jgi:hypothetical protein
LANWNGRRWRLACQTSVHPPLPADGTGSSQGNFFEFVEFCVEKYAKMIIIE